MIFRVPCLTLEEEDRTWQLALPFWLAKLPESNTKKIDKNWKKLWKEVSLSCRKTSGLHQKAITIKAFFWEIYNYLRCIYETYFFLDFVRKKVFDTRMLFKAFWTRNMYELMGMVFWQEFKFITDPNPLKSKVNRYNSIN